MSRAVSATLERAGIDLTGGITSEVLLKYLKLKQERDEIGKKMSAISDLIKESFDDGKHTVGPFEVSISTTNSTTYAWKEMPPSTLERIDPYRKDSTSRRLNGVKMLPSFEKVKA